MQILVVAMAFMELIGIASIGPFMALVADKKLLENNQIYGRLFELSGLAGPNEFIFAAGVLVLVALAVSSVVCIVTTWRMAVFAHSIGVELADRLYTHYLNQSWLFHANGSSAQLTNRIATECHRVTQHIVVQFMTLNSRFILAFVIGGAILIFNPIIAFTGVLIFSSAYYFIYIFVRRRLMRYGQHTSETNARRYRLMNEGFGGIKDVLLLNRRDDFITQFNQSGQTLARAQGISNALSLTPRYFIELLAFGVIIALILVLIRLHNGVISEVLPALALYALAGFKLLPALQGIYGALTTIRSNVAAFYTIRPDLIDSQKTAESFQTATQSPQKPIPLNKFKNIRLENVTFTYPTKQEPALDRVCMDIAVNSVVGIVGASGSGKSTAIDLLLGLIVPDTGTLSVDGQVISADNMAAWQANIGFVPQSIFLSEGTIAENVAFGIASKDIDMERVREAIRLANLDELVADLADGLNTRVGERGVRLSGGQRQRIGIARALYNDSSMLVFDEATSALDGITEKVIMDAIHALSGKRTIVLIAHRIKTVQQCQRIYLMDEGRVVDSGPFEELVARNAIFRKMAESA